MPLHRIDVKDFQSIASASVELGLREGGGGITTIVGPSSTGKSALLRAMRMLARNGASIPVRAGAKVTQVGVVVDDKTVTIERGPGKSTYAIGDEVYSKAGVTVPEEVAAALRLRADTPDPHFSFQFDRPYLLAETGSVVSELLGKLTTANVLRSAVREGARRHLRSAQSATAKMDEAKALAGQIKEQYAGVDDLAEAVERARTAVSKATGLLETSQQYRKTFEDWQAAQRGLEAVAEASARYAKIDGALQAAGEAVKRYEEAAKVYGQFTSATAMATSQHELHQRLESSAADAEADFHAALVEAGTCPMCGKATA